MRWDPIQLLVGIIVILILVWVIFDVIVPHIH